MLELDTIVRILVFYYFIHSAIDGL